jgi:hypothetical protein
MFLLMSLADHRHPPWGDCMTTTKTFLKNVTQQAALLDQLPVGITVIDLEGSDPLRQQNLCASG